MTSQLPPFPKRLEAEAITIMREVVAEFRNPVLLYSIGKDSSVMVTCDEAPRGSSAADNNQFMLELG
jgi:hypothetical protein